MSIEDISGRTRIKVPLLQAIERGEFEQLPGEFFTRAFLRTYARELHLPPDDVVGAYDASRGLANPPSEGLRPPIQAEPSRDAGLTLHFDQDLDERSFARRPLPVSRAAWPSVGLAALLLAGIWIMPLPGRGGPSPANEATANPSNEPGAVGTAGAPGTGGALASPGAAADGGGARAPQPASAPARPHEPAEFSLEIRPTRRVWVTATADGTRVVYRLLQPGERVRVHARDQLSFRVGDAGAFQYSTDGSNWRTLGAPGEVREARLTRENYASFGR